MRRLALVLLVATATIAISVTTSRTQPKPESPDTEPKSDLRQNQDAQPLPTPQLSADSEAGFRIELLGREPSLEWTKVAAALLKEKQLPLGTLHLLKGQDPCSAVLDRLNFRTYGLGCSVEFAELLFTLNPPLRKTAPVGAAVTYPTLPIRPLRWFAGFNRSLPGEQDRYTRVSNGWRHLTIKETVKGPLVQLELQGFRLHIPLAESAEATQALLKTLESLEHYNTTLRRFDTQVVPLSNTPLLKKGFSLSEAPGWVQPCMDSPASPPPGPRPPYVTMLGGTKDDMKCVANCVAQDNCPEIVLIDQAVAPHPEIAPALGLAPAAGPSNWCPFAKFEPGKHHGTHMAGLMVSSGTNGFTGLAPRAFLDNRDIGEIFEQNIKTIVKAKNFNYNRPVIFVFASQFPGPKEALNRSEKRYVTPGYISDILSVQRLWVVAAGQPTEENAEPLEIGDLSPASPMNLGDQGHMLVVTACEKCYSKAPIIAPWANFSSPRAGLVNIAAFGGTATERVPSAATAREYSLAHGTSQSAALVGGLAAAMMSCYPIPYANGQSLKTRLLVTARPPLSRDVAKKVTSGIVDASKALLDPNVHWVTLKSPGTQDKVKEVNWCKQKLTLKDPTAPEGSDATFDVDVRHIRRLVRHSTESSDKWFVFYQKDIEVGETIRVTTLAMLPDQLRPLLYFRDSAETQPRAPTSIDDINDLLIGLPPRATVRIPPDFAGCKP